MNKIFANIRTLAALLIASAALAACSNEDSGIISEQPAQEQGPQVYTLTIQAGKADNAQTRALALDGAKLNASWENGDVLTVYNVTKSAALTGSLTASNASGSTATFSGTLTGTINVNDELTLTYHPIGKIYSNFDVFEKQDGTLASAAALDRATAEVTVKDKNGGNITINEEKATFKNETAVLKITMKDGSNQPINAKYITIAPKGPGLPSRMFDFTVPAETYTTNGANGVLYFTLPNQTEAEKALSMSSGSLSAVNMVFTATIGNNIYTVKKDSKGYTFKGGEYYATELSMTLQGRALSSVTANDLGNIIGADGKVYISKADATAGGTTAAAMIAYVGSETGNDSYKHGLAIALNDELDGRQKSWDQANTACNGKTNVPGCGPWGLPSEDNWKKMFASFDTYESEYQYADLNYALFDAGEGDNSILIESNSYWTSTNDTGDSNKAITWTHSDTKGVKFEPMAKSEDEGARTRACFAF